MAFHVGTTNIVEFNDPIFWKARSLHITPSLQNDGIRATSNNYLDTIVEDLLEDVMRLSKGGHGVEYPWFGVSAFPINGNLSLLQNGVCTGEAVQLNHTLAGFRDIWHCNCKRCYVYACCPGTAATPMQI